MLPGQQTSVEFFRFHAATGREFAIKDENVASIAVDNSIPCLTGKISYADSFGAGGESVIASKITYDLAANKLTKQQVMNFFKLWMVAVGPTNDE